MIVYNPIRLMFSSSDVAESYYRGNEAEFNFYVSDFNRFDLQESLNELRRYTGNNKFGIIRKLILNCSGIKSLIQDKYVPSTHVMIFAPGPHTLTLIKEIVI